MAQDLVQLRWQHIRTFEKVLELTDENIRFRKQITSLLEDDKSRDDKIRIKKMGQLTKKSLNIYRASLKNMKVLLAKQVSDFMVETNKSVLKLSGKFNEALNKSNAAKKEYVSKCTGLESKIEKLKKDVASLTQSSVQETSRIEGEP